MPARLEHVGIAVAAPEPVRELLSKLLGLSPYKTETVASEGVVTHFLHAGSVKIELLESTAPDSPIARFLEKRGEGIHHLAFEVSDLDAVLRRASSLGLTIVNPTPKAGADGKEIFFLHPRDTHGILIEFCRSRRFPGRDSIHQASTRAFTAYEVGAPEAPGLILIHDVGSSALRQFGEILPLLEGSIHATAIDVPDSGEAQDQFTPAARACISTLLAHPQSGRIAVGGAGLGAFAAVSAAAEAPHTVSGLILIDPNLMGDDDAASLVARWRSVGSPTMILGIEDSRLSDTLGLHGDLPGSTLAVIPKGPDRERAVALVISDFVTSLA